MICPLSEGISPRPGGKHLTLEQQTLLGTAQYSRQTGVDEERRSSGSPRPEWGWGEEGTSSRKGHSNFAVKDEHSPPGRAIPEAEGTTEALVSHVNSRRWAKEVNR
jgi:hypothetical protein